MRSGVEVQQTPARLPTLTPQFVGQYNSAEHCASDRVGDHGGRRADHWVRADPSCATNAKPAGIASSILSRSLRSAGSDSHSCQ
jgi:hypothetical protein